MGNATFAFQQGMHRNYLPFSKGFKEENWKKN